MFASTIKKFNPVSIIDRFNFLSRFFFRQFTPIFKIKKGSEFTSKNLLPLPTQMNSTQALLRFKTEQKRLRKLTKEKKIYLREVIWNLIKQDMKWAVIFKFMEQSSVVAFPMILKAYLRMLATEPDNFGRTLFFAISATILNFSRTMLSQHSAKRVGACKTLTGQILRSLFFQKLNRANYVFSFIADTSLIAKMNFFDIDAFINFIGVVPTLFAAPSALIFAIGFIAVSLDIGWYVWIMVGVFLIASVLILIFNYIIIVKRKDMNFTSSMRNMILSEMIPNMVRIKLHSLENFFKRKLDENRVSELRNTKIVHFFSTLMHFCFYASPLVASCSAISVYNVLHPVNLNTDLAYFIIIIVGNLQGPLISLASSVDEL